MSEKILQSDSYDTKLAKQCPITVSLLTKEEKAIIESLHIAKRTIDNMDPFEREVHTFDREEIREIEKTVRGKLKNPESYDGWHDNVELTKEEVKAIEQGLTDMLFSDNYERQTRHIYIENMLRHHTSPHN